MHRPRSARTARAMKLGALCYLLLTVSVISTAGLLAYAFWHGDRELVLKSLILIGVSFILFLFYKVFASSAACPLCRCRVLSGSGAQRNRNARRLLGSYRLRVARDLTFKNSFVCPYCSEGTLCVPKDREIQQARQQEPPPRDPRGGPDY